MGSNPKMPGMGIAESDTHEARGVDMKGRIHVSELISDRAAAPSPFGDDQTFPLPVDRLIYTPTTTP